MTDDLTKRAQAVLAPVERDESIDRIYIPLPGGWEVQTKGRGSSFRIADIKSGQQWTILDASHPDQFARDKAQMFERMAMEIRTAYAEQRAEIERLRNALVNVIGHTGHTKLAPDQLHIDLLASIERIARVAIEKESTHD